MNTKFLLISTIACTILFSGCNYPEKGDPAPHRLQIIRFSNPDYINQAVAIIMDETYQLPSDYLFGPWKSRPSVNPYYELGNGYLLVDWRLSFALFKHGVILNESWNDANLSLCWPMATKIIDSYEALDTYWIIPYEVYLAYVNGYEDVEDEDMHDQFAVYRESSLETQKKAENRHDTNYQKISAQLSAIDSKEGLSFAIDSMSQKYKEYLNKNFYIINQLSK